MVGILVFPTAARAEARDFELRSDIACRLLVTRLILSGTTERDEKMASAMGSHVAAQSFIRDAIPDLKVVPTEIPLAKEGAKEIWTALNKHVPLFALLRADRPSTDEDGEVQDPMRLAVRQASKELETDLRAIEERVEARAGEVATRTLEKLAEFDENLSSTLTPKFRADRKWEGVFKLSLTGDDDIPINKRGSGVRRLVLLGFFQAEIERRRANENIASVVYAIEEPETSQHPANQIAVVEALKELAMTPGCQVLLTTHVPALAGLLPVESIKLVTQSKNRSRAIQTGDDILKQIADELGVLPDVADHRVKVLFCVEGPTDVEFFKNITPVLRTLHPDLPEVGMDPRIALVPLGGSTLKDWVNKRYLAELRLPEVHVYDKDVPEYATACTKVNAQGHWATLTRKREIENYLHTDAIHDAIGIRVTVDDVCDVEAAVRKALGRRRVKGRSIKRILNEDAAAKMTPERLRARNGVDEIADWYRKLANHL